MTVKMFSEFKYLFLGRYFWDKPPNFSNTSARIVRTGNERYEMLVKEILKILKYPIPEHFWQFAE